MRVPSYRSHRSVSMNMTPMIDVVFLLIIFFLVSSHLAQQETQLEIDLPAASTAADSQEPRRLRVTINVLADGQLIVAGEPTPKDQIASRLELARQQSEAGIEVRIRGHRDASYSTVEPVLVACAKTGVWNVAFAVREQ